eukprot:6907526-Pyramimonas_sp.AAC.1
MVSLVHRGAHQLYANNTPTARLHTIKAKVVPNAQKRPSDGTQVRPFKTLIFDLDGTLYPDDNG